MDSREQFEEWAKVEGFDLYTDIGGYYDSETATAYHAWQASREALAVERDEIRRALESIYEASDSEMRDGDFARHVSARLIADYFSAP